MNQNPESMVKTRLIDVSCLADYVGLSTHTVYTMVSQRRIRYVKVGRLVKFDWVYWTLGSSKNTVMLTPQRRP